MSELPRAEHAHHVSAEAGPPGHEKAGEVVAADLVHHAAAHRATDYGSGAGLGRHESHLAEEAPCFDDMGGSKQVNAGR